MLKKALFICVSALLSQAAFAKTIPLSDCSQLAAPKTVLLTHAEWCGPCQRFLPKYKAVSDKAEFAGWTFYTELNNDFHDVCGREIQGVPSTFAKNMQALMLGDRSVAEFEKFLRDSQSSAAGAVCKQSDKR